MADKKSQTVEQVAEQAAPAADQAVATTQEPKVAETTALAEGVRARRVFVMKQFLPNPDWINKNIVAGGQGTKGVVGRVFGQCTSTEDKHGTLPNGEPSMTIALKGSFEAESFVTGEVTRVSTVYLPMAYAEQLKALFVIDKSISVVEIDCDIGLEATGKAIPYEWVLIAFREGKEMDTLKRMRATRPRPAGPFRITAPDGQTVISGPTAKAGELIENKA